ncbi:MAG TPA: ROK family protein [Gaiellaceae bacterium]|nr:ROK family protein [Gaiellaceae bacterium]
MERGVVLGLDFGGTKIAAAVADLDGTRLGETTIATDPARGAHWNVRHGVEAARELVAGRPIRALCACTFGIPAADGILLAPAIDGWEDLALGDELAEAFPGVSVRLATDVKAAAEAETRFGALAGYDPAVYVNLGTGLAVGIVCGGNVITGANGAAGEIGYNLRAQSRRGRLEDVVSGVALARATDGALTAEDVFAGALTDVRLARLVAQFVDELSFALVNLAVALDPARIAVGGGMTRSWDRLEGPLRRSLAENVPFPPELVLGAFPFEAALVGALALAVEAAHDSEDRDQLETIGSDRGRSRA